MIKYNYKCSKNIRLRKKPDFLTGVSVRGKSDSGEDDSQKEIAHMRLGDMVQNIAGGYSCVMTGMESECLNIVLENGSELCGTNEKVGVKENE